MGENLNPASSTSVANIQARPTEHEGVRERQGQAARVMQAKKCPCISRGEINLHCTICGGKGYLLDFQKNAMVVDENSPHNGGAEVFPYNVPITKVYGVQKFLHISQGGNIDYTIVGFNDTTVEIEGPGGACPPRRYEKVRVTYEFCLWNTVTGENSEHTTGSYIIHTIGTRAILRNSSNPFDIHGDLTKVTRVYNVTKDETYDVKKFCRRSIVIDDKDGAVNAPESSDVLAVDYQYAKPETIGTGRLDLQNTLQKVSEDLKEGDLQGLFPAYSHLNKGDIVTFLVPRLRSDEILRRGSTDKDELPQFDVVEVMDPIIDEDGNKYYGGTDFNLSEYNDLVWINGPANKKRYSLTFLYRPSYRIYRQNLDAMTNESKYFPQMVTMRFMNRFDKKDFIKDL
jgi:hypothetical protein